MSIQLVMNDNRTDSLSVIHCMTLNNYLELVDKVYIDRGGIEGQRAPLKTKTAIRIRKRMVEDIANGAVLPPVVIGVVVDALTFDKFSAVQTTSELNGLLERVDPDSLSIIDGMQRTTALKEALQLKPGIRDNLIRLEIWVSKSVDRLIYRMLVLNTGQVPWDMKRQLETIYQPILKEISCEVPNIGVLTLDSQERRTQSGQFQGSKLIEFFIAFSSRKTNTDIKERVAEDFARLDATEATANADFISYFIEALKEMVALDDAISSAVLEDEFSGRIKSGKDIFKSAPAGIGFMAASAVFILGAPGFSFNKEKIEGNIAKYKSNINSLIERIKKMKPDDVNSFSDLGTLNQMLDRKSGKVGEFEREYFYKAFSVIFEHGNQLDSLEACWMAY